MNEIEKTSLYQQLGLSQTSDQKNAQNDANDKLGQEQFLELMTAQLMHQDPFKPMENGEFLGQMAQFGTVSGISELNSAFGSMSAALQSNQALQASTMVGREVLVPSEHAVVGSDGQMQGAVELDAAASDVTLNVMSLNGELLHQIPFGPQQSGLVEFNWDGVLGNGSQLAPGTYQIQAVVKQGQQTSSAATLAQVQVESVTLGKAGQEPSLNLAGLGEYDMSSIRKIM